MVLVLVMDGASASAVNPGSNKLGQQVGIVARDEVNFGLGAVYACQVVGEAQSFDAVRDH